METKIKYIAPILEIIELDNEISLALESNPPFGPDESNLQSELQSVDPYKSLSV
jgi:hypothetical protein